MCLGILRPKTKCLVIVLDGGVGVAVRLEEDAQIVVSFRIVAPKPKGLLVASQLQLRNPAFWIRETDAFQKPILCRQPVFGPRCKRGPVTEDSR